MTLRIHRSADDGFVVFGLSGRVDADYLGELRRLFEFEAGDRRIALDLKEVKLVDREAVRFLAGCEARGIRLRNCPPYIREWIVRERDSQ
jgi:hypothetical protein